MQTASTIAGALHIPMLLATAQSIIAPSLTVPHLLRLDLVRKPKMSVSYAVSY